MFYSSYIFLLKLCLSKLLEISTFPQILVALVLCFLFYAVLDDLYLFKFKRLPPGPLSLPIIGGAHLLGREPCKNLLKMSAKYGDLFSLRLGMRERVVYVMDPEVMKQVKNVIKVLNTDRRWCEWTCLLICISFQVKNT